jgi:hypothetical protein
MAGDEEHKRADGLYAKVVDTHATCPRCGRPAALVQAFREPQPATKVDTRTPVVEEYMHADGTSHRR